MDIQGNVEIQKIDTIDFEACKTKSDYGLIKPHYKDSVQNTIETFWTWQISTACADRSYDWSSGGTTQVCFESYYPTQMCSAEVSGGGYWNTSVSGQCQTAIVVSNGTYNKCVMFGNAGMVSNGSGTMSITHYLSHIYSETFNTASIGLLTSFSYSGHGTVVFNLYDKAIASTTFSGITLTKQETMSLTWTISFTPPVSY